MPVIKINFLCILLFYEFLMYFFVFWPFVFVVFFSEICGRNFLKHNNAMKQVFISAIDVEYKNKHIYMNYVKKLNSALILYTKSHFGAIFGPTCMYKKLRNFRTVPPGVTNLVQSKCAGNLKEKSHKACRERREYLRVADCNHAKCRGGGLLGPPPSLLIGLSITLIHSHWLGIEIALSR